MGSYYSIIRYLPDPVSGESINVGVIVVGDGDVRLRFLRNWHRVKEFSSGNIKFLRDFATSLQTRHELLDEDVLDFTELKRLSSDWAGSIQFTEPRASLKSVPALFDEIVPQYLHDEAIPVQKYRDRQDALVTAVSRAKSALRQRFGMRGAQLVKTRYPLQGQLSRHTFDLVAANGKPFFAAQTLSVELPDARRVEKDIDAAGWALADLRKQLPGFPASIVALMPSVPTVDAAQQENIDRLRKVSERVQVEIIPEADLDIWSAKMAALVPHAIEE